MSVDRRQKSIANLYVVRNVKVLLGKLRELLCKLFALLVGVLFILGLQRFHAFQDGFRSGVGHVARVSDVHVDAGGGGGRLFKVRDEPVELGTRCIVEVVRTVTDDLPFGVEES